MIPTAATCAVLWMGRYALIAKRYKPNDPSQHGKWYFPGGKTEPDETPEQCIVREMKEEFGIVVEPLYALSVREFLTGQGHAIRLTPFACVKRSGHLSCTTDTGNSAIKWISLFRLPAPLQLMVPDTTLSIWKEAWGRQHERGVA